MPRPIRHTYSPTALDRDGICASQTPGGAGALTINGALASSGVVTFAVPQHITVYCGSDISARVFTFTGTNRYDQVITETITGVNAGTVAGTKNFKTVTSVTVDAGTGAAVEVGVDGTFEGPWIPLNYRSLTEFNVGVGVDITGTVTATVQHTFSDVFSRSFSEDSAAPISHPDLSAISADADGAYVSPVMAVRMKVTAHSSGGSVGLTVAQSGY